MEPSGVPPPPPEDASVRAWSDWISSDTEGAPDVIVEATSFKRLAQRMRNIAGGTDGWEGKHWAEVPEIAFEPLAVLWRNVWGGRDPPTQWWHVRMAFIQRQVGIAHMAWRIGLKSAMEQLTEWACGVGAREAVWRNP